ncbi:hypothetical protein QBC46DRAFT_337659 [Diplogelasinospora grovesii]|uniref:Uncharacterized protein n=1 Tax=Diplogelasinospora grovesii TaxID=303347 RepID=A0AAN6S7T5_9PEZI|nr:hypothetical protein QBC46DRAFT_337659 [Diplogelasinospora grovesii]
MADAKMIRLSSYIREQEEKAREERAQEKARARGEQHIWRPPTVSPSDVPLPDSPLNSPLGSPLNSPVESPLGSPLNSPPGSPIGSDLGMSYCDIASVDPCTALKGKKSEEKEEEKEEKEEKRSEWQLLRPSAMRNQAGFVRYNDNDRRWAEEEWERESVEALRRRAWRKHNAAHGRWLAFGRYTREREGPKKKEFYGPITLKDLTEELAEEQKRRRKDKDQRKKDAGEDKNQDEEGNSETEKTPQADKNGTEEPQSDDQTTSTSRRNQKAQDGQPEQDHQDDTQSKEKKKMNKYLAYQLAQQKIADAPPDDVVDRIAREDLWFKREFQEDPWNTPFMDNIIKSWTWEDVDKEFPGFLWPANKETMQKAVDKRFAEIMKEKASSRVISMLRPCLQCQIKGVSCSLEWKDKAHEPKCTRCVRNGTEYCMLNVRTSDWGYDDINAIYCNQQKPKPARPPVLSLYTSFPESSYLTPYSTTSSAYVTASSGVSSVPPPPSTGAALSGLSCTSTSTPAYKTPSTTTATATATSVSGVVSSRASSSSATPLTAISGKKTHFFWETAEDRLRRHLARQAEMRRENDLKKQRFREEEEALEKKRASSLLLAESAAASADLASWSSTQTQPQPPKKPVNRPKGEGDDEWPAVQVVTEVDDQRVHHDPFLVYIRAAAPSSIVITHDHLREKVLEVLNGRETMMYGGAAALTEKQRQAMVLPAWKFKDDEDDVREPTWRDYFREVREMYETGGEWGRKYWEYKRYRYIGTPLSEYYL